MSAQIAGRETCMSTKHLQTRSNGSHKSAMLPPAQVKGVLAKKPAMNRKAICAPMFGARAEAIIQTMYIAKVAI